jgi:hypothetical protein
MCQPLDQCHMAGSCDPTSGTCSSPALADGTACDDKNGCTQADTCTGGVCVGGSPVTCEPTDDCHDAACDALTGKCASTPKADGTACAQGTCKGGVCTGAAVDAGAGDAGMMPVDSGGPPPPVDAGNDFDANVPVDAAPPPPRRDAGHPASDASAGSTDDGGDTIDQTPQDSGGCGCKVAQPKSSSRVALAGIAAALLSIVIATRRRRKRFDSTRDKR